MARARTFDPMTLLDTAVELFWVKGYGNCSMDDVVAASGVARYGIYQQFGDKNALYRAALSRYHEQAVTMLNNALNTPSGGFSEICDYFASLSASVEQGDRLEFLVGLQRALATMMRTATPADEFQRYSLVSLAMLARPD